MANKLHNIISAIIKAKFQQNLPEQTTGEFQDFLIDDNYTEEKERALLECWDAMEDYGAGQREYRMLRETKRKLGHRKTLRLDRRFAVGVAAVVVPLMILAGGFWYMGRDNAVTDKTMAIEWTTRNGQTHSVALPDSTKVWINSGSKLILGSIDAKRRAMSLVGESYFEVAKDEERPFTVQTEHFTITVMGTSFNVDAYPDNKTAKVTLDKGEVKINTNDGRQWTLSPAQQFVYDKLSKSGKVLDINKNSPLYKANWKSGNLVCDNMTMTEIFKAVERKYNVVINIDSSLHFSQRTYVTQFLDNDTPNEIMELLGKIGENFCYKIKHDTIMLSEKL